jgi:hypothetical protein
VSNRRTVLGLLAGALAGTAGCVSDPGRRCRGATVRLSLSPADAVSDPLVLDAESLSAAADAVVETAIEGEHVERCVVWDGDPGPSPGLRAVGSRLESHLGIDLADREEPVRTDARRDGTGYRLELVVESTP